MSLVGSTFDSQEPFLHELLTQVHSGALQLPDFQRGWVWDDDHIRSLIASVSLSYPIGAVMLLETGGDGARFAPRPVEGAPFAPGEKQPERLILDGQQRLTSLYLSLRSGKAVKTQNEKKQEILRRYYLDMAGCLNEQVDRFDAIVGVPEDRIVREDFNRKVVLDLSSPAKEFEARMLPLFLIFDPIAWSEWKMGFQEAHKYAPDQMRFLNDFEREVWMRFQTYKLPVLALVKSTPKEAVCQVFENVNTGGVALTVFELLTATYAADNYPLRKDWEERSGRLDDEDNLKGVRETEFLQTVTLLATYRRNQEGRGAVAVKRKDVLALRLEEYKAFADAAEAGYREASRLLIREKVFRPRDLPYQAQLVPLAAILAIGGADFAIDTAKAKLARWYWCGVFGELYGSANEARFALDVQQVTAWLRGGVEPRTIADANFAPTRLLTMRTRQSAAYKGLMALLMQDPLGSPDFLTGDPIQLTTYMNDSVDIHHLFPRAYCQKQGIAEDRSNAVVNKAPLTRETNIFLGGRAPSLYLGALQKRGEMTPARVDGIIAKHAADPVLMRADDFDSFFRSRGAALCDLIERAMGKTVVGRDSEETVRGFGGELHPAALKL